ncbi:MAG: hypothetical protein ABI091_14895, partial [Ferruginibacter sp.]
MKKLIGLVIIFTFVSFGLTAQKKNVIVAPAIQKVLDEIRAFQTSEYKQDSAANHPLGSNTEEHFLNHYNFYSGINTELNNIDKNALS